MRRRSNYALSHEPLHGFTLMELLVVISIIALLLSILLPSLGKARDTAIRVVCGTRLRDLARFNHMYAGTHEGKLPPLWRPPSEGNNISWSSYMTEYITSNKSLSTWGQNVFRYKGELATTSAAARRAGWKSVLSCPSLIKKTRNLGVGLISPSYARNYHLNDRIGPLASPVLARCKNSSDTIFFGCSHWGFYGPYCNAWPYMDPQTTWWMIDQDKIAHGKFFNIVWVDGHISHEEPQDYASFVPIAREWFFE